MSVEPPLETYGRVGVSREGNVTQPHSASGYGLASLISAPLMVRADAPLGLAKLTPLTAPRAAHAPRRGALLSVGADISILEHQVTDRGGVLEITASLSAPAGLIAYATQRGQPVALQEVLERKREHTLRLSVPRGGRVQIHLQVSL